MPLIGQYLSKISQTICHLPFICNLWLGGPVKDWFRSFCHGAVFRLRYAFVPRSMLFAKIYGALDYFRLDDTSNRWPFDCAGEAVLWEPGHVVAGRQGARQSRHQPHAPLLKGNHNFDLLRRDPQTTISVRLDFLKCVQIFLSSKTQICTVCLAIYCTDLHCWREI